MSKIVEDIYKYLESYSPVSEEEAKELSDALSKVIKEKLSKYREPSLSMSSIGKPARKLWMDVRYPHKPNGAARLKFLYGDILETLILWLIKRSGHSVTDCQKSVSVEGVSGSIDCIIDGNLKDIKSCSPGSYKKFSSGDLPSNDPFGYCAQIAGYNAKIKSEKPGFIAVNKVTGEVCEYNPDIEFDLPNPKEVIKRAKRVLKKGADMPKEPCYPPVQMGTGGNLAVNKACHYCPHLKKCWKDVRTFKYSYGLEYLIKVVKEPRVEEIKNER